jgi:hypothetical protein
MKAPDRRLARLVALARRAAPRHEAAVPEDVRFFAQRTVSAWKHRRAAGPAPDPWQLWERVGNWSLAGAATALAVIILLQPSPPPPNPFDAFGPVDADEISLF